MHENAAKQRSGSMSLEVRRVQIKDIIFGDTDRIEAGTLFIQPEGLKKKLMEDQRIKDISIDLAKPGESVRIVPVKDVIEPRAKVDGQIFSGICGPIEEAGQGITYALKGCAIVTTGPIVGFQEGLIDMSGPAAEHNIFSELLNIVVDIEKEDFIDPHEHEETVRLAGIRAAEYVGNIALGYTEYDAQVYEWKGLEKKYREYPELPKVVYIYNCMSQGLLHDTYFYGRDTKTMVPTLLSPLEVMDGALVSGNCVSPGSKTTTYHHQNNAVIRECLLRHGREINFIGIILNPLMVTLEEKYRNTMMTVRDVKMLGAQGAVVSQEGFGNPTTDLMLICQGLERNGIKTVIITNEDAGADGMSESLPDSVQEADAIISTGNSNQTIHLPKMERTIGRVEDIAKTTGGTVDSIQPDGSLIVEVHGITGRHNLQGNTHYSAQTR